MLAAALAAAMLGQVASPTVLKPLPPVVSAPGDDFLIAMTGAMGAYPYENAAASTRANRQGETSIVITCGAKPMFIRLAANAAGVLNGGKGTIIPLPALGKLYPGTDNQIVRLPSGALLAQWDAATDEAFSGRPPRWAGKLVTWRTTLSAGLRGAQALLTSNIDANVWTKATPLDFGSFEGGKYGKPRPMSDAGAADVPIDKQGKNPDGSPKYWIGGEDRTELYSCPFTNNVYMTTRIISGPVDAGDSSFNCLLVLGSTDMGKSWKLMTTMDGWSPAVMTSTPDGRLWILQTQGDANKLTVTEPAKPFVLPATFTSGAPIYGGLKSEGPAEVDMELKVAHPSIARLVGEPGAASVLVSYQVRNVNGNQEFRIVKATVDAAGKFAFAPAGVVAAASAVDHSALYGAFIQPELASEAPGKLTDSTLFYWYDAPKNAKVQDRRYAVRYAVFRKGKQAATGYLTRKAGKDRTWTNRFDPGDYMKGASFLTSDGRVAFVPQWSESDGIRGSFLTAAP